MNYFLRVLATCALVSSAVSIANVAKADEGMPRNAPPPTGPSSSASAPSSAPATPPPPPPGPTTPPPAPTVVDPGANQANPLTPPPMVLQPTQPLVLDPNTNPGGGAGSGGQKMTRTGIPVGALRPEIRITTWDLNLDFGYGAVIDTPENRPSFFGRARAGVLHVRDDWFYTAGVTYDLVKVFRVGGLDATNFGIQLEAMHIQYGIWGQLGGLVDTTGHGGVTVAAGWSLFGVEYQARTYEALGPVQALYGKIRIPITIIYHAVVKKDL